jgi:hypothetical protein
MSDVFGAMDFVHSTTGNKPLYAGRVVPSPNAGKTYTHYDGFDLFTISWEDWSSSVTGSTKLNVQIRIDIWTGDFRICFGPGSLASTCAGAGSSEVVETAFMSCRSTVAPFGTANPACSYTAEAGKSWVWPPDNHDCLCGNLNYFS